MYFMLGCSVVVCAHGKSGWARGACKPNPPPVRVYLLPSFSSTFRSFALSADSPQPGTSWDTCERRRAPGFLQGSLSEATVGRPQGRIATNLGAPGEVQVEEVAAHLCLGQVPEAFICESVAVGQAQVLEVQTRPVYKQKTTLDEIFSY